MIFLYLNTQEITLLLDRRSLLLPRYKRILRPGHQRLNSTSQLNNLHVLTTTRWGPQMPVVKTQLSLSQSKFINTGKRFNIVKQKEYQTPTYPLAQPSGPCKQLSVQSCQGPSHQLRCHWGASCKGWQASPHQSADTHAETHAIEKELGCGSSKKKERIKKFVWKNYKPKQTCSFV